MYAVSMKKQDKTGTFFQKKTQKKNKKKALKNKNKNLKKPEKTLEICTRILEIRDNFLKIWGKCGKYGKYVFF